jgi:starch phosphorylase
MVPAGDAEDHHLRYTGTFTCDQAGRYGATVRIVPAHPDLVTPLELGLVAWG